MGTSPILAKSYAMFFRLLLGTSKIISILVHIFRTSFRDVPCCLNIKNGSISDFFFFKFNALLAYMGNPQNNFMFVYVIL